MAVQTVACPGCKATLKAPEQMAGKKAKCKKCGETFRIPGGPAPSGEPEGDSQFLSAMELPSPPAAANPFDFGGEPAAPPEPKPKAKEKSTVVEKPKERKPEPSKLEKKPEPPKADKIPRAEKVPERKPEKASPKPPPAAVPVEDDEEDIPAAAIVEDDEPAEEPAPEATSDPFSFDAPSPSKKSASKEKPRDEKKEKSKPKSEAPAAAGNAFAFDEASGEKPNLEPIDEDKPKRGKPEKGKKPRDAAKERPTAGGSGKFIIIGAAVFALIVGGIVGGVLIYLSGNKTPEQASNEKKDPPPKPEPTPPTPPDPTPPNNKGETPKTTEPNPKDPTPPKKENPTKKGNASGLALAPGNVINLLPPSAKPESVQEPNTRVVIIPTLPAKSADAFAAARKVFPAQRKGNDLGVVWQTEPGLQNVGQKLLLGMYSPQNNKEAAKLAFDGDGSADPVCDLAADGTLFLHAHLPQNKITVWDTRTGAKVVDGFNPYLAKKDVKLAAAYLTEPPLFFITVSAAGDVNAFNVNTKEAKPGKFAPSKPPSKPLVAGKHIVPGADRRSVMIFAGGSFYSVTVAPDVAGTELVKLDGEPGRVFGMASGSKTVIAFETEDKKDRAVMEVRTNGQHVFHRWPDKDAGEPAAVAWVDDGLAMVSSTVGSVLWFESEGKDFKPVALARTPGNKGLHTAHDGQWTLLPDPANPKQCVLVEYSKPQSGIVGALDSPKQPPIVILNDKGLLK